MERAKEEGRRTHLLRHARTRSRLITPFTCTTPLSSSSCRISPSEAEAENGLSQPSDREGILPILDPRSSSERSYSAQISECLIGPERSLTWVVGSVRILQGGGFPLDLWDMRHDVQGRDKGQGTLHR